MKPKKLQHTESLTVLKSGVKVGELYRAEGRGIYFVYDRGWLATGFNLSPLTMDFNDKPQLARDPLLFEGLHGPFSDSLPDGWGMLLMDRFFNGAFGDGTSYSDRAGSARLYGGSRHGRIRLSAQGRENKTHWHGRLGATV
ncbi:HipA N-terminal domain-containing protein [Billgrantia endophytica]|uniref:HipA N-terminal domain-containing protein n=1 Tax=Billgrantia endophytica TaxID=2033802 RepID=UPI00197AF2F9